jgi:hypothetical protein
VHTCVYIRSSIYIYSICEIIKHFIRTPDEIVGIIKSFSGSPHRTEFPLISTGCSIAQIGLIRSFITHFCENHNSVLLIL